MFSQGQTGLRAYSGLVGRYGPGGNMGKSGGKGDKGLRGLVLGTTSSFAANEAYEEMNLFCLFQCSMGIIGRCRNKWAARSKWCYWITGKLGLIYLTYCIFLDIRLTLIYSIQI